MVHLELRMNHVCSLFSELAFLSIAVRVSKSSLLKFSDNIFTIGAISLPLIKGNSFQSLYHLM